MPLTDEARDRALLAIFAGPLIITLVDREGQQPQYGGYQAQPITLGLPYTEDGGRWLTNEGEVRFPPVTADGERPLAFWVLRDATGAALASDELENPQAVRVGQVPLLPPGAIAVGLT